MKKFKMFLKQLFCKHDYKKVSWYEAYDDVYHVRYAVTVHRCNKCDKEIHIDER